MGVGLVALLVIVLAVLLVQRHRRSRAEAHNPTQEDLAGRPLPAQLATRTDAPELEGDRGIEVSAQSEKEKVNQKRTSELEAESSHLRKNANVAELP